MAGTFAGNAQQPTFDQALLARDIERIERELRMVQERVTLIGRLVELMARDKSIALLEPGSPFAPRDAKWPGYIVHRESFTATITLAVLGGEITLSQGAALARAIGEDFKTSGRWLLDELSQLSLRQHGLGRQLAELRKRITPAGQHARPAAGQVPSSWPPGKTKICNFTAGPRAGDIVNFEAEGQDAYFVDVGAPCWDGQGNHGIGIAP